MLASCIFRLVFSVTLIGLLSMNWSLVEIWQTKISARAEAVNEYEVANRVNDEWVVPPIIRASSKIFECFLGDAKHFNMFLCAKCRDSYRKSINVFFLVEWQANITSATTKRQSYYWNDGPRFYERRVYNQWLWSSLPASALMHHRHQHHHKKIFMSYKWILLFLAILSSYFYPEIPTFMVTFSRIPL